MCVVGTVCPQIDPPRTLPGPPIFPSPVQRPREKPGPPPLPRVPCRATPMCAVQSRICIRINMYALRVRGPALPGCAYPPYIFAFAFALTCLGVPMSVPLRRMRPLQRSMERRVSGCGIDEGVGEAPRRTQRHAEGSDCRMTAARCAGGAACARYWGVVSNGEGR